MSSEESAFDVWLNEYINHKEYIEKSWNDNLKDAFEAGRAAKVELPEFTKDEIFDYAREMEDMEMAQTRIAQSKGRVGRVMGYRFGFVDGFQKALELVREKIKEKI